MTDSEMWSLVTGLATLLLVLAAVALVLLLSSCAPAVSLGADAVRTTCETCRRVRTVCDAAAPAPSGSAP